MNVRKAQSFFRSWYNVQQIFRTQLSRRTVLKSANASKTMAEPNFKLYYFDWPGRGESIRLTFILAGKKFADIRYGREEWAKIKPTMPFEANPVLEFNGEKFGESVAIRSYLAKEFGLHGKNNLEQLRIDQVAQLVDNLVTHAVFSLKAQNPEQKAELEEKIKTDLAPRFQRYIENIIKQNGTGFVVGNRLTLADIIVYDLYTGFVSPYVANTLEKYPLSKAVVKRIAENDNVKDWYKNKGQK